ncbi:HK97-gp10 family putative phage morphogenesis protein [Kocuria sp. HSID16901]|uniref:HK97-gp10 family putative phage morphogenesis protein n=1 Tax=Kocuria sp. HSID16901 TaxID=2419505 RepID=UPI00065FB146|nr:HK97-gp10 family putative phage morphogenesis protein [Kocuria sp. HSID16901]
MRADTSELDAFAARVGRAPSQAESQVSAALTTSAAHIVTEAKTRAPVRTGFLRGSIAVVPIGRLSVSVGATANYAAYVEQGTSRMAARPYMRPALEKELPVLKSALHGIAGVVAR